MSSPQQNIDDNVGNGAAAAISEEDIANLNTIQDFDVSTADAFTEYLRLQTIPGYIKDSELNLLLWMILEHELQQVDMKAMKSTRNNRVNEEADDDNVDGANPRVPHIPSPPRDPMAGLSERERRRVGSHSSKSRRQIEYLLRSSGINLPFHQLSVLERKSLFQQFANSSVMLPPEKYSSIPEVFEALRTRSKIRDEFKIGERLGGGNFGDVYEVVHRQSNITYAAKRISLSLRCFEEMRMTLNESKILKSLNHENIIKCSDAWLELQYDSKASGVAEDEAEPLKFYVLMDYCSQSLHEWILEVRKIPELKEMVVILKHTLAAVNYLHTKQILHFDINTRNIMWADKERTIVKLGDFGLAIKGDSFPYQTGTVPYAAPDPVFTSKSDVYSLGVTILEIADNIATTSELVQRLAVMNVRTIFPFLNNVLPIVLSRHPNVRPSAQQIQTMLSRIINPPVRPVLELEEDDYRLLQVPLVPNVARQEEDAEHERGGEDEEKENEDNNAEEDKEDNDNAA